MTTPLSSGPRRRSLATAPCGGALRERLRYPELHHHRGHDRPLQKETDCGLWLHLLHGGRILL